VPNLDKVASVTGAAYAGFCALREGAGDVVCWGLLGPTTITETPTPKAIAGVHDMEKMGGFGLYHACALRRDHRVVCWGDSAHALLGFARASEDPEPIPGLDDVVDLSVGAMHSCALRSNGDVLCWGDNTYGQLGDGTTEHRVEPTPVVGL
jgi:alpha-tubulin suppressor-like RCC1 family protein